MSVKEKIARDLSIRSGEVERLIARAPHSYKTYRIAKKSGGYRTISQPARETKFVQYWLIENVLRGLNVHSAATAYAPGSSVRKNAEVHRLSKYLVKLDFRNFFTSIKRDDVLRLLHERYSNELTVEDLRDISRLVCVKYKHASVMRLSILAPSSPLISNAMLYKFDSELSEWSAACDVRYTRYADDLAFSTLDIDASRQVEPKVRKVLGAMEFPKLRLNTKKTLRLSKANSRRVTGIVITNDSKLSIGRAKKREIKSLVFRYSQGALDPDGVTRLQGLLGFALDVERSFVARLRGRYGGTVIDQIFQHRKNSE